jgi:dihydropteroate synthase
VLRENYYDWVCGQHHISLTRPRVMGVLNVTPDSFSDGGSYIDPDLAIKRGMDMLDEGADIIDVGGESTRPGFTPVSPDEEVRRVLPVVTALAEVGAVVSIDTRHVAVARACLEAGASILNDVEGFTDPAMIELATEYNCGLIVMHWNQTSGIAARRSVTLDSAVPARAAAARAAAARPARPIAPSNRRFTLPEEAPIMREVMGFLGDQARQLMRAGISHDRICIDPGPGFDKTADVDVVIQRNTQKLVSMGYPVMCAVSRKRFVGALSGVSSAQERDAATMGVVLAAIESGARIVRVHNVACAAQTINTYWATSRKDARQGFISLGSNVGDRLGYLARAAKRIDDLPLTCVVALSHAYETEPAYGIATPVANAVAEIRTELAPLVLMDKLLEIEAAEDRVRTSAQDVAAGKAADATSMTNATSAATSAATHKPGNGPRTLDCDLCWLEGEEHAGRKLTLPHPGLGERDYVLVPMEDLMSDPERFLTHAGVAVKPYEERVGNVLQDLGPIDWQS